MEAGQGPAALCATGRATSNLHGGLVATPEVKGFANLERVYASARTQVFRARRERDGRSVVLKGAAPGRAEARGFGRIEQEYAMLRGIRAEGVVAAIGLHASPLGTLLELEDGGPLTLADYAKARVEVADFLRVALTLTSALANLHAAGVTHRDLAPSNVAFDPVVGTVRLIDFDLATRLGREWLDSAPPVQLEGTLGYLSPEQTGRMNRPVDRRADLYSLGAIFYRILGGRTPLTARDAGEAVIVTVGGLPVPISELRPDVPAALGALVMRLLSKLPEDRFRSADAVARELHALASPGTGPAPEFPRRFELSDRLYGRDDALAVLTQGIERARRGERVTVAVVGPSGIGRSAVVQEIDRRLVEAGGRLVAASFERDGSAIPHSGFAGAIRELVRRVIAGGVGEVERWRSRLLDAMGAEVGVIVDLVPDAAVLFGRSGTLPAVPPHQAECRARAAVSTFFRVFHAPAHPLLLLVDDVQDADADAVAMLEAILAEGRGTPPFVVLAVRAEPLDSGATLEALRERLGFPRWTALALEPLGIPDVVRMLVDGGGYSQAEADAIARAVHGRTGGNPLHTRYLLAAMHPAGTTPHLTGAALDAVFGPASAVALAGLTVGALPGPAGRLLALGAAFGRSFTVGGVALAAGQPCEAVAGALGTAVEAGLLHPVGDAWRVLQLRGVDPAAPLGTARLRFAHGVVHEAAAARASPEERTSLLAIGRALLGASSAGATGSEPIDWRLDIVRLLRGVDVRLYDPAERGLVAGLHHRAGQRALAAAAFTVAVACLKAGLRALPADPWAEAYGLAFALHRDAAEASVGARDPAFVRELLDAAGPHARTVLDLVALQELRVRMHVALGEHALALAAALEGLRWLGVELPRSPNAAQVALEGVRTRLALRGRSPDELRTLPAAGGPDSAVLYRLLVLTAEVADVASPQLPAVVYGRLVREALVRGVQGCSGWGFAGYSAVLATISDDLPGAMLYGQLARDLVDRFGVRAELGGVELIWLEAVQSRTSAWRSLIPRFSASRDALLATGDGARAAEALGQVVTFSFLAGVGLPAVAELGAQAVAFCDRLGARSQMRSVEVVAWTVGTLRSGGGADPGGGFSGEAFSRTEFLAAAEREGDEEARLRLHAYEGMLALWFERFDEAKAALDAASALIADRPISVDVELAVWCDAIAQIAFARRGAVLPRRRVRQAIARVQKRAEECPANTLHRLRVLEAELASLEERETDAVALYDEAITLARTAGLGGEYAFALQLAARHFGRRQHDRMATTYLLEARRVWQKWGAVAPAYGLGDGELTTTPGTASVAGSAPVVVDPLTPEGLLEAARGLVGELDLNELMRRALPLVIALAGGDGGVLVVEHEGKVLARVSAADGVLTVERGGAGLALPAASHVTALLSQATRGRAAVVVDACAQDKRFARSGVGAPGAPIGPASAMALPLRNGSRPVGSVYVENCATNACFTADRVEAAGVIAPWLAIALENARLYDALRGALELQTRLTFAYERFLPRQFLEQLGRPSIVEVDLGDQIQREISVLFADIRGFTRMCEQIGPARSFAFVNSYLHWIEPAILGHGGFVNAFLGDGIMALFPTSPDDAVRAALGMLAAVDEYNRVRARSGDAAMRIGIGLNTGPLMVGVIGGNDRMDRGVIGDAVNVASRVEGMTKHYGATLLLTAETASRLVEPERFQMRVVDRVVPAGRSEPLTVVEVLDGEPEPRRAQKIATMADYARGLAAWDAGDVDAAQASFEACLDACPEDIAARLFVARCRQGVPVEAVTRLTEK